MTILKFAMIFIAILFVNDFQKEKRIQGKFDIVGKWEGKTEVRGSVGKVPYKVYVSFYAIFTDQGKYELKLKLLPLNGFLRQYMQEKKFSFEYYSWRPTDQSNIITLNLFTGNENI